jgi:hypothetical protein
MDQVIEHQPTKHEALSSNLGIGKKKKRVASDSEAHSTQEQSPAYTRLGQKGPPTRTLFSEC